MTGENENIDIRTLFNGVNARRGNTSVVSPSSAPARQDRVDAFQKNAFQNNAFQV